MYLFSRIRSLSLVIKSNIVRTSSFHYFINHWTIKEGMWQTPWITNMLSAYSYPIIIKKLTWNSHITQTFYRSILQISINLTCGYLSNVNTANNFTSECFKLFRLWKLDRNKKTYNMVITTKRNWLNSLLNCKTLLCELVNLHYLHFILGMWKCSFYD